MPGKYIIRNAWVVSVDPKIGNVPGCDVIVENDRITAVGPNLSYDSEYTVIDGTDAIVSPGFVDTHRHTWQTQTKTLATDHVILDYFLALRNIYGSSYAAEDAYLGNFCGAMESISCGTTYLVDHSHVQNSPAHADAAVRGLQDAKVRGTFCYALYKNPYWDGSTLDEHRENEDPDWRIEDARRIKKQFFASNRGDDLLRFGFVPAEPDMTPIEEICENLQKGREMGAALQTLHIAIGKYDPGWNIIRQLGQRGLLGPDLLFSHCTALADDEFEAIRASGAGISATPDTELQMGMSHPVGLKATDLGCRCGLGVDVCCSTPADMFHQMRLQLQSQRHQQHEAAPGIPYTVSRRCAEVLHLATLGGAKAVGLDHLIGSITPGKKADLIVTRCDSLRLTPVHDPVGALVAYATAADVDYVFINGEVVKANRELTNFDWTSVRDRLLKSTSSIMQRAEKAPLEKLEKLRQQFMTGQFHANVAK
jgi:cytosine/adenosine deaminase-related metal-dependent hydrolase